MTIYEAIAQAKQGVPVRRGSWASGKTLTFEAGLGSTRAVAVIVDAGVARTARNTDIQQADFAATDWTKV